MVRGVQDWEFCDCLGLRRDLMLLSRFDWWTSKPVPSSQEPGTRGAAIALRLVLISTPLILHRENRAAIRVAEESAVRLFSHVLKPPGSRR